MNLPWYESPWLLLGTLVFLLLAIVVRIARHNIHWSPRGITPQALVDSLKGGGKWISESWKEYKLNTKARWVTIAKVLGTLSLLYWLFRIIQHSDLEPPPEWWSDWSFTGMGVWLAPRLLALIEVVGCILGIVAIWSSKETLKKFQKPFMVVGIPLVLLGLWFHFHAPYVGTAASVVTEQQLSTPRTVLIPAGGRTVVYPVPAGMHAAVSGTSITTYTVYQNGAVCAFNAQTCSAGHGDGPVAGFYVQNNNPGTAAYAEFWFEHK